MLKSKPVIGVANQKGGVGKTTIIRIVLEYLAKYLELKVLACDLDSQVSLSARYLDIVKNPITGQKEPPIHDSYSPNEYMQDDWDGRSTIANIFFGEPVIPYKTRIQNIEIAPADEAKLLKADTAKQYDILEQIHTQLYKFITLPDLQNEYDAFLLDTPPARGPITACAFKAMTHLIIPLELEMQSVEGLQGILTSWKQEALQRPPEYPLELVGILPNKVHSRRSSDAKFLKELEESIGEHIMPFKMFDRTDYPESDLNNRSIFELPNSNEAKKESIRLGKFIEKRIFV